jgi:hypothetical protein
MLFLSKQNLWASNGVLEAQTRLHSVIGAQLQSLLNEKSQKLSFKEGWLVYVVCAVLSCTLRRRSCEMVIAIERY